MGKRNTFARRSGRPRCTASWSGRSQCFFRWKNVLAQLEEVVVTARRIEEVDHGCAARGRRSWATIICAIRVIASIQDIIELTPGATWNEFTRAQPTMSMRGIEGGNFGNSSLESAVQLVVDGVAQTKAFMMSPPVYDLQRVEVMRGPQGTTFGRNATLGLMHFVHCAPDARVRGRCRSVGGLAGSLRRQWLRLRRLDRYDFRPVSRSTSASPTAHSRMSIPAIRWRATRTRRSAARC